MGRLLYGLAIQPATVPTGPSHESGTENHLGGEIWATPLDSSGNHFRHPARPV